MKKEIILMLGIFLIGFVSAVDSPTHKIWVIKQIPNTNYDYTFNYTTNSDCSGVLLSYTDDITTDLDGDYLFSIPIQNLTQVPSYICEYRDGALRKVHQLYDVVFNEIFVKNLTANNITSNKYCNSTDCYTVDEFLVDNVGSGDVNQTITYDKANYNITLSGGG